MSSPFLADYSGWVKLKATFVNLWHRVYCVLRENVLSFYTDETMTDLTKSITMTQETKLELLPDTRNQRFSISMPGQQLAVFANTAAEAEAWMEAIQLSLSPSGNLTIDDFKILSVIGRGFYGKVMLVQKVGSDELYAIKSIHKERLIQSNKCHTVISERNILMRTKSPFVVRLKFAFQTRAKFYLGLEYVSGGELFYHMERRGSIPLNEAKLYVAEIAIALNYLHSMGIVYRDLKPENILLDSEGHIKITDFGLAKDMITDSATHTMCGTTEYMAPEIVCQVPYSYEVDFWALGVLFYEMLTENTPFFSNNKNKMLDAIMHSNPCLTSVTDMNAASLIKGLLAKDPKKRLTFEGIKAHPLYRDYDWEKVNNREYKPEFVPPEHDPTKPVNFDKEFTTEMADDSYVPPASADFPGFSFTASTPTDSVTGYGVFADDPVAYC